MTEVVVKMTCVFYKGMVNDDKNFSLSNLNWPNAMKYRLVVVRITGPLVYDIHPLS
jgi:hypothetical protein